MMASVDSIKFAATLSVTISSNLKGTIMDVKKLSLGVKAIIKNVALIYWQSQLTSP
jgi:hypothetical protein